MTDRLVFNTGPLIALARMEALGVPPALGGEFVCPQEVRIELDAGAGSGYPIVEPEWLHVANLHGVLDPIAVAALDEGEAAVIQLAREHEIASVCIDERKGRRFARSVGLRVTGSLGLLLRAKLLGTIPRLRPLIERGLKAGLWYDPGLVSRVLQEAGEE